ncbi:MAG TPA: hypothetical protein VG733_09475 [Chthoniobacteraceae bacterium]|nr:hypothetical protein [Chthoniobacteraceae bacterium]
MNATRRFVVSVLLATFLLFIAGTCRAADPADDYFHGDSIPEPPAQHEKWSPPAGVPKELAQLTRMLFDEGMADPRGCEYRLIKVVTGDVWGGADDKSPSEIVQTHGWVLPSHEGDKQRFAVCWNGLVYPVLAVGDPCDLDADVKEQLKPVKEGDIDFLLSGAPRESVSVEPGSLLLLKSALLLRLGEADAAGAVWDAWFKATPSKKPPELCIIYDEMAGTWLFSLYNRAVCAWMRRDDNLALVSLRQLAPIVPVAKKDYKSLLPKPPSPNLSDDAVDFLDEVPSYLSDMERRHKEAPHKSALELGREHFPTEDAWVKALIADLEDVYAPQDGQPGWPELDRNATIEALVKEGNDAVEPLLDCLEHDNRYTRTVHFWRDFAPSRTMIRSYEAAYTALYGIFKTNFLDITSTGQDLTNSGPEARAKVVAAIRAYWAKRKGSPQADQWFTTLADDGAKPEAWVEAMSNIVKSGPALRDKKGPGVADLLQKRIDALSKEKPQFTMGPPPALALLKDLIAWDPKQTDYARGVCNTLAANYAKAAADASSSMAQPLVDIAGNILAAGDTKILADYAGWLRTVPPENVSCGFEESKTPWFRLLWEHQDNEDMQKTAEYLFMDDTSPWLRYLSKNPAGNEALDMLRSPLVGIPAFRRMLLAKLADTDAAGASGFLHTDFWVVRYGDPENGTQVMASLNPHDPLSKDPPRNSPFRVCDFYAWALSDVEGMPVLEFYWPEEKRNAAVQATAGVLMHYGARYNVTPNNRGAKNFRRGPDTIDAELWFPKPTRPATQEDVDNAAAIFFLPADEKPRLWQLPQYPAKARWTALKEFSSNAGYGDEMGRQWVVDEYQNQGRIWQAEEGFIDGKWQRFFGFTGSHHIARVPASEIEFPAKYPWTELTGGFDCEIEAAGGYPRAPLRSGASLPLALKLRNRSGNDQNAPETLYKKDDQSFADGVVIHLYRKSGSAPGEIVKETVGPKPKNSPKPNARPATAPGWEEVAPKSGKLAHFQMPEPSRLLAPAAETGVGAFKLEDFFDFTDTGDYYVEVTFDAGKLKFAGGTSNYVKFHVGAVEAKPPQAPAEQD